MRDDFAIFILTHGRAGKVVTKDALASLGYTGKLYLIIDNEDEQADAYYSLYGRENVIMFDKIEAAKSIDAADNFGRRTAILYARNKCWDIARDLGINFFLQLDDDVTDIQYRWQEGKKLKERPAKNFDAVCEIFIDWLVESDADTVAFCQGGDFIGGADGRYQQGVVRKAMNSFFCRTERPIKFVGTMNEDVSMYTNYGNRGRLIMSSTDMCLVPKATQSVSGGMTEEYKDAGTYVKSFYSVMVSPHAVKIGYIADGHAKAKGGNIRVHHAIDWERTAAKILDEKWRKQLS